jgi:hypothetical protein
MASGPVSRVGSREPQAAEMCLGSVVLTASRGRKAFEISESLVGPDKFLWVAEDGDGVGLGSWCRELGQVFQLAVEEEGGIGELFPEGG